ncbi:hypothetical protein NDU88_005471 [Pleurodeles waltl]|uniref:Uncharacterized protein n=1 Tax=Pleurodeles waltl TaxID=8319 RepID=A0AAV7TWP5_PLEWA|nr:hypothetical protein NDU88_005471 [Pleurodeles waltl]
MWLRSPRSGASPGTALPGCGAEQVAPQLPFQMRSFKADIEGRYLLLNGLLDKRKLCFLNVYVPNNNDREYYLDLGRKLLPYLGTTLFWARDFNCMLDGMQEPHGPRLGTKPNMVTAMTGVMNRVHCLDIWHMRHLGITEYTLRPYT